MKVVFVRCGRPKVAPHSTLHGMVDGLAALGHEVDVISYQKKVLHPGDRKILSLLNDRIPDGAVCLLMKGGHLPSVTIKKLREMKGTCKLVFFSADSLNCGPRDGRAGAMSNRAMECEYSIFTGYEGCEFMHSQGYAGRLAQIFQGFRPEIWHPSADARVQVASPQVSFLGSFYGGDGGRRRILASIRHIGFKLTHGTGMYLRQAAKLYRTARINLNIACGEIISNRVIRILASGGFCLTPMLKDLEAGYEPGVQMGTYEHGNLTDLHEKIRYWMEHGEEAQAIAGRGLELARTRPWSVQMGKIMKFVDGEIVCDGAATRYVS